MATVIEQEERLIRLYTPLGTDVLLLESVHGHEELSHLFSYDLAMLSERDDISAEELVGKNVTFIVKLADGGERFFNGFVRRFTGGPLHSRKLRRYQAEIVPWLWFLTRCSDCRIFQDKSVPEIVEQIFQDLGFSDFEIAELKGEHPKREYCAQYRETSFNFVSRLMEEEGIFYYFRHEDGKHTLVLADQIGAYKDCPENEIEFSPGSRSADIISSWEHDYEFRSGKFAQTDYNFETPDTKLLTSTDTLIALPPNDAFELYDYWGRYKKTGDGDVLTKLRMEEEEAPYDVVRCTSGCRTLYPGGKFTVKPHECPSEEGKAYVITAISHSAVDNTYLSGAEGTSDYQNSFTCIPDSVVFRPPRITPRPIVQGPQTAVVVGPSGEEIYPDKYGRVKIQFHWDREGKYDENSSCWVRVSSPWAGKLWGAISIPRVGHEVIIDFLEGDPDYPVVTGRVYNANNMPSYGLPDNKTISTLKTNSSTGGGGFNEIRFEDKKGEEQIFIHAQKNQDIRIKNDCYEWIGNNRHLVVKKDQFEHVENNRNEKVDADHMEEIGKDRHLKVTGKEAKAVDDSQSLTVGGDVIEVFKGNHSEQTSGDYYLKGSNIVIEATSNITLKVGGSHIAIEASGIKMESTQVKVKGSASADFEAGGAVTIKGAVVKIN